MLIWGVIKQSRWQILRMDKKQFYVIIEQDEDGIYVGEVPQLKACYSQGETIDELLTNIREVIEMCLEEIEEETKFSQFVGIQTITV
jgi:predicted RNase H-like HicB family nuclease